MQKSSFQKLDLPDKPGVYFFLKKEKIIYIGKATSLRDRVRSYFAKDLISARGPLLVDMVFVADEIRWEVTDSVLEALILEANLIKKYQPHYNTKEKDDKSFNYVCVTHEGKLCTVRGKELEKERGRFKKTFGPYVSGGQLRVALRIIRKIFPFFEEKKGIKGKEEFYKQIKLLPDSIQENEKNIRNLVLFFEGKKKALLKDLAKEMKNYADAYEFERAAEVKRQIFALNHINDIALIKSENSKYAFRRLHPSLEGQFLSGHSGDSSDHILNFRIEGYDIAHMSGRNMVGVMTVIENGEVNKSEYKKFKIKSQKNANDTGALTEVLERRFAHTEWAMPDLIVVDGGRAQINFTQKTLHKLGIMIPVVSVLKDEHHKPKGILGNTEMAKKYEREILLANSEAHRFAINYHKQMRHKNFLPHEK